MSFIITDQGLINLHFVKRVRRDDMDDRPDIVTLYDRAGFAMGKVERAMLDEHLGDIVAAGPGVYATVISYGGDYTRRPLMPDIWIDRVPVVAWRVHGCDSAVPIFVDPPIGAVFIETDSERLILPHEAIFDDLSAAKEWCLQTEQRIWDRHQPQPPEPVDDDFIGDITMQEKYDK